MVQGLYRRSFVGFYFGTADVVKRMGDYFKRLERVFGLDLKSVSSIGCSSGTARYPPVRAYSSWTNGTGESTRRGSIRRLDIEGVSSLPKV